MQGVCVPQGYLLGGRGAGEEVEAAGCRGDGVDTRTTRCGVHQVHKQEAYVLPARVGKGVGNECRMLERRRKGRAK